MNAKNKKNSKIQIIKLLFSSVTGNLGSLIFSFIIGLLILKKTESVLNFGFSQIIGPLISVILLPFLGSVVDKYNKKKIVVLSQFLSIFSLTAYYLVLTDSIEKNLIYTYILLTCLTISDKFLGLAKSSAASQMVLEEDLQKYQSLKQMVGCIIGIVGPLIAGFLVDKLKLSQFVILEIIFEVVTIFIILSVNFKFVEKEKKVETENDGLLKLFKDGLVYVRKSRVLIFIVIFSMVMNLCFSGLNIGFPIVYIKQLKFSGMLYSILMSSFSFGMLISGILLSRKKDIEYPLYESVKYTKYLILVMFLFSFVLAIKLNMYVYFALFIIFNLLLSYMLVTINIPLDVWMLKSIPIEYQGRVFNIIETSAQLLMPLGILIFSILFEKLSSSTVFAISSTLAAVCSIVLPRILKINLKTNEV